MTQNLIEAEIFKEEILNNFSKLLNSGGFGNYLDERFVVIFKMAKSI